MNIEPRQRAREFYHQIKAVSDSRVATSRVDFLVEAVRDKCVLDIGCVEHTTQGIGRDDWMHAHIIKSARLCIGMDSDCAEINRMKDMGFQVFYGDATAFATGQRFEVIVAGEVLEHLLNAKGFLDSCRDNLLHDGRLVLTVPNANTTNYFMQNLFLGYEADGYDHCASYTPLTLFNLLRKCGYTIERLVFIQPPTTSHHKSKVLSALVAMFRYIQLAVCLARPSMARTVGVICRPTANERTME